MPPKTKINSRKLRRVARFTVRRIANKNPRNARILPRPNKKIVRVATSLFALVLLVGGIFTTDARWLKSELVSSENFVCEASFFTQSFNEKVTRLADLSRKFPDLFAGAELCTSLADCAAVQKIYEAEVEIEKLENSVITLQDDFKKSREAFVVDFIRVEDGVFFCPNVEICEPFEAELRIVQECEKEFEQTARLFEIRKDIEESYIVLDANGHEQSAIVLARDSNKEILDARERAQTNSKNYSDCVAMSDASVCQEYLQRVEAAWRSEIEAVYFLKDLQPQLERIVERLDFDIVALELGKKDSENFEPNEGKGWCSQKLAESKKLLNNEIIAATSVRSAYELALKNLAKKKELYEAQIMAELEASSLHAAAEIATVEAEAELDIKRSQAEILFEMWSSIRVLF